MVATLPVSIAFDLPSGWEAAEAEDARDPEAAFYAIHPASVDGDFTANITISGEVRNDAATLWEIADESVDALKQVFSSGQIAERREIGTPDSPGLTQVLRLRDQADGMEQRLLQVQVFLSMLDVDDSRQRAVIRLVFTTTPGQFEGLVGDFQQFLGTVRPAQSRR